MKLIIGQRTDSATYEKYRHVIYKMENDIFEFFESKTYSHLVDEINVDMVYYQNYTNPHCKRPSYYEDKTVKVFPRDKNSDATFRMYHLLFVDIPLPDEFATCCEEEAVPMIGDTLVKYFAETPLPLKIRKSFDKDRFIADLQSFFSNYNNKK